MAYVKYQFRGYKYQDLGELKGDFDANKFSSYIERILLTDYYDLLIMPQDQWKADAIRAFTNEQFSLMNMQYLTDLEDKYFRNLSDEDQRHIMRTWFREIRSD